MTEWGRIATSIMRHPKMVRACRRGGSAAVHLWLAVWAWNHEHDGESVPEDVLDTLGGPVDEAELRSAVAVLVDVRLLDRDDCGLVVHDFDEWAASGEAWDKRKQANYRKKAERDRKRRRSQDARDTCHAEVVTLSHEERDTVTPPPVTDSAECHASACAPVARAPARATPRARSESDPDPEQKQKQNAREPLTSNTETVPVQEKPEPGTPEASGRNAPIPCPKTLGLSQDMRANAEMAAISPEAIDSITRKFVGRYLADPSHKQPQVTWLKWLNKAVLEDGKAETIRLRREAKAAPKEPEESFVSAGDS